MGLSVHCACGNPLEGDNLDLVVTLSCPHCRRELTLEIDDPTGASRRPLLTVLQGPHWVGQKFVVPVGVDLSIGSSPSNWLALEHGSISDVHCRLRLLPDGGLLIEDQKSAQGTWVGPKRIARGKLIPSQPFRLGQFQFRMDLCPIEAPVAPPPQQINLQEDEPSVRFDVRRPQPALIRWLLLNRFQISRLYMFIAAWLMGIFHAVAWYGGRNWTAWSRLVLGAILITGAMIISGSRVSLAHRHFKYASLGILMVLTITDLCFGFQGAAIACLCLAACLTILVMRVPTGAFAILSFLVGLAGLLVLTGATSRRIIGLFSHQVAG
jgi:hypothetical protein